jgi:hypothetical protein
MTLTAPVNGVETEERPGASLVRATDKGDEGLEHLGAESLVVAQEHAQPPRQRADPLADRHLGDDLSGEMQRGVRHAAAEARRAESSALAAERDEPLEPEWTESTKWTESREVYGAKRREAAPLAPDAHAAVLQAAAAQVLLDLAHDEARQSAGLLGALAKRGPVRLDRPVEHRLFGAVALVAPLGVVVRESALSHGRAGSGRVVPACASPASCEFAA